MEQRRCALYPLVDLRFGQSLKPQTKGDVFEDREMREEGIILEHHRYIALRRMLKGDVTPV